MSIRSLKFAEHRCSVNMSALGSRLLIYYSKWDRSWIAHVIYFGNHDMYPFIMFVSHVYCPKTVMMY